MRYFVFLLPFVDRKEEKMRNKSIKKLIFYEYALCSRILCLYYCLMFTLVPWQ